MSTDPLKLSKTRMQGFEVKLAPEGEMVHLVLQLEPFELEERRDGRERVIALDPAGGVGERANPVLDVTDLWKTSTFRGFDRWREAVEGDQQVA